MFAPSSFDSASGSSGSASPGPGQRALVTSPQDGPPPHAAPRPAGADTTALAGAQQEDNPGAMTPKARVLAACAMLQQAANILATDAPMVLQMTPNLVPDIQTVSSTAPQMMDELSRMPNPMSMFSAIGAALTGGGMPGGSPGGSFGGPGASPALAGGGSPSPILSNPASSAGVPARPQPQM